MSKYTFEKLSSARFEHLVQALLEKHCRADGHLTQFGDGKDGAREATWSQPSTHKSYTRPINASADINKEWVFQAKFHDIGLRGWDRARADVEADLSKELDKIVNKYEVPCHKYILVTNVPFTGVRHVGTRDKVNRAINAWLSKIPQIEVWDATDLSRMLDADPDTRTTFLGEILPGDILRELLKNLTRSEEILVNSLYTYLKTVLRSEGEARAEEAGDEGSLKLEKVFVDLDLSLNQKSVNECATPFINQIMDAQSFYDPDDESDGHSPHLPSSLDCVPASFALLRASYKSLLIKGGPGVGKSTLTQFLSLYHASRLVDPALSKRLAERLKLSGGLTAETLDAHCEVRFPLRIELRRYSKWVGEMQSKAEIPHFAAYFAKRINERSSSSLCMEDIFTLATKNPVLLILDGLDEVPQPSTRSVIFRELQVFLDRCESEECNINVILSSRPQGYRGEFDGFEPLEWQVVDLSLSDFNDYSACWLAERIKDIEEQEDARQRIDDGMESHAVRLMAKTLLQATVMLTIARRKYAIPHAKHKLYEKFVEVIFEREQDKLPIIRGKADELKRLHEKVGFELICRLEKQDGAQTLQGAEFRSCVIQVIYDYGSQPTADVSQSDVVEDIVVLAKDRLCLLAGKGEDQADIDFVIQPFREYFAAAYLAGHEDADPDRVHKALVSRQHIWGNVLQFYAAFQSASQQRNWIAEADGTDQENGSFEYLIEMTRRRRALVRILPEFERRHRNKHLRRAFQNLMECSTRWTWRDRRSTAGLLDAYAQNESHAYLKQCFGELSVHDEQNLLVELDLLVKTAKATEIDDIRTSISKLTTDKSTTLTALLVAHRNNLSVDVESVEIEYLQETISSRVPGSMRRHHKFNLENWKGLSDGKVIDIALSKLAFSHGIQFKEKWINDLFDFLLGPKRRHFEVGEIGFIFPKHFYKVKIDERLAEICEHLKALKDCTLKSYLIALMNALENSADISLYEKAEVEESILTSGMQLAPHLKVVNQLGPAPSCFKSNETWIESRSSIFDVDAKELSEWVGKMDGYAWLILFIPEAGWPHLEPLVRVDALNELNGSILSRLKLLAGETSNFVKTFQASEDDLQNSTLLRHLVMVASKIGADYLLDSELTKMIRRAEFSLENDVDANEFLARVEALQCPPDFCACVVGACLSSKEVNLPRVVEFWTSHCNSQAVWTAGSVYDLMDKFLAVPSHDAVRLAASLRSTGRLRRNTNRSIASKVTMRYCSLLENQTEITENDLMPIFGLPAQMDELKLWMRVDVLQVLRGSVWSFENFRERLLEIVNAPDSDSERVRHLLGSIIQNRSKYPAEISLSVIDAIHRLDEIASRPLEDADWQELSTQSEQSCC